MADKSSQLILDALSRAAAGGAPLHGGKTFPGLFPATNAGRQAATRCQEAGYLAALPAQAPASNGHKAKTPPEAWGLSDKGLAYILGQVSPREVLDDLVRALEDRAGQLDELLADARQTREQLTALRCNAEVVLRQLVPLEAADGASGGLNALFRTFLQRRAEEARPSEKTRSLTESCPGDGHGLADTCVAAVVQHLSYWQGSGATEDCPLPDLYRQAGATVPGVTIGQFHDTLRRLHDTGRIYLHPWTGPLYDLPEPPYALLIGHEVAYYASLRQADGGSRNGD